VQVKWLQIYKCRDCWHLEPSYGTGDRRCGLTGRKCEYVPGVGWYEDVPEWCPLPTAESESAPTGQQQSAGTPLSQDYGINKRLEREQQRPCG